MALYYTSTDDLLRVVPPYLQTQLCDDNHDGTEDVGVAELLLEQAESLVDSYISARYDVPLTDSHLRTAKRLTLGAWVYFAHERLGTVDDRVERAFELVIRELERIADGKNERSQAHTERSGLSAEVTSATRVFSRTTLNGL